MKTPFLPAAFAALAIAQLHAADSPSPAPPASPAAPAATAINALGIDLLAKTGKPGENALLSPYSIQVALAMAYAGADGKTRAEMAKTLHYPKDDASLNAAFAELQKELDTIRDETEMEAKKRVEGFVTKPADPVTLITANRLFGQSGFEFRKPFLDLLNNSYNSPLQELDFAADPDKAEQTINTWVSDQTQSRIQNLIPDNALTKDTSLVLVNAIYLKAPWSNGFAKTLTKPRPFHVNGGAAQNVPVMIGLEMSLGYAKREGYTAVSIPYTGGGLQFLILLPSKTNGLAALEAGLTPKLLAGCAKLDPIRVDLAMPKFKLEPPVMALGKQLQALGMKSAFSPTADFSRMAAQGISISEVFHKTFLSLDEHGTEAAAATSVSGVMSDGGAPGVMTVDHPFLFAIQDCKSGACLFIGRVGDPR